MQYEIKAIPTTYAGVNFRSRLEARWAAFFDLCGWTWDYEPFDLNGWSPDFLIKGLTLPVLVEVKPIDLAEPITVETVNAYTKAVLHSGSEHALLLLGLGPVDEFSLGSAIHTSPYGGKIYADMAGEDNLLRWREAGNRVQWRGKSEEPHYQSINDIVRRAADRARNSA